MYEGFDQMEKMWELDFKEKVEKGVQKGSISRQEEWNEKSLGWELNQEPHEMLQCVDKKYKYCISEYVAKMEKVTCWRISEGCESRNPRKHRKISIIPHSLVNTIINEIPRVKFLDLKKLGRRPYLYLDPDQYEWSGSKCYHTRHFVTYLDLLVLQNQK